MTVIGSANELQNEIRKMQLAPVGPVIETAGEHVEAIEELAANFADDDLGHHQRHMPNP